MISSCLMVYTQYSSQTEKGLYKTKERHLVVVEYYYSLEEVLYVPFSYLTYSMLPLLYLVFDNNNAVLYHNLIFEELLIKVAVLSKHKIHI